MRRNPFTHLTVAAAAAALFSSSYDPLDHFRRPPKQRKSTKDRSKIKAARKQKHRK